MAGKEAIIAPATAPDDDIFVKEVSFLLSRDWYETDDVYLHSLDGYVGQDTDPEVSLQRPKEMLPDNPDPVLIPDDQLIIRGEVMRLGDISWMERESDGDGNRYGHIIMKDGRYRCICFGDLSR